MSDQTTAVAELKPGQLLTVRQTAERLGISEAALRFQIHQGRAPRNALVNGRRMFVEADVVAFVAEAFGDDVA